MGKKERGRELVKTESKESEGDLPRNRVAHGMGQEGRGEDGADRRQGSDTASEVMDVRLKCRCFV